MLGHYIFAASRNALRSPLSFLINAFTLALGLVCFLAVYGVVGFWGRAESHFANSPRTYVLTTNVALRQSEFRSGGAPMTNPFVAPYLREDFPALEAVARARVAKAAEAIGVDGRELRLFNVSVDPEFLTIFDLPFVAGDSKQALMTPRSAVLTEDAAVRLFGTRDVVGRTIVVRNSLEVTVTGVTSAVPEPSHLGRSATARLRFDVLTSMDVYEALQDLARDSRAPTPPENWLSLGVTTYVLLPTGGAFSRPELLERQLAAFITRHAPSAQLQFADVGLGLKPVTELLGESTAAGAFFVRGTGMTVPTALLLLGTLVLVVACVNYANLATARALPRMRDVGLRRALGAGAAQIIAQHLVETGILTAFALLASIAITISVAPLFQAAFGIDLTLALLADSRIWLKLVALVAVVAVVAGGYPAFALSTVKPALTVRRARLRVGRGSVARVLIGVQFAITSVLLTSIGVAYLQNVHLRETGLGMQSLPLLVIQNDPAITKVPPELFRQELESLPGVSAAGLMGWSPWTIYHILTIAKSPDETAAEKPIYRYIVGQGFFEALNVSLLAGRTFKNAVTDFVKKGQPQNIIVDRAFSNEFGFDSPENAVGQIVYVPKRLAGGFGASTAAPMKIIGVVETKPLAMAGGGPRSTIYTYGYLPPVQLVRLATRDVGSALSEIDALWKRLAPPGVAMERRFADDLFNEQYEDFARINKIFGVLAALSLSVSIIGLCAIVLLVVNARIHEIGVRKTAGATTGQILRLLIGGFASPVLVANLVALPFAYMVAKAYLKPFIYPIDLTPVPFAASLGLTLTACVAVVLAETWRAALMKPSDILRAE